MGQKALMTGRDVICRDAPKVVAADEHANEVGLRWTGRAEETRLKEGDVRHTVGCAVAHADGDGGCKYKAVRGGPGGPLPDGMWRRVFRG